MAGKIPFKLNKQLSRYIWSMKHISVIIMLFLTLHIHSSAQEENFPVGKVGVSNLFADANPWGTLETNAYQVDVAAVNHMKSHINGVEVTIVMGFWCEDSQREVPRFVKIWQEAGGKIDELWAVDREKKSVVAGYDALNIQFVPTFIFYRNGAEIGRIVETPKSGSLENDILQILHHH